MAKNITGTTKRKRIFYPGRYYVVDTDNNVTFSSDKIVECRNAMLEGEMLLICLDKYEKKHNTSVTYFPQTKAKADKIIVNFNENTLTIFGESVKLDKVDYDEGTYNVDLTNYSNWIKLVEECNSNAEVVEFVGEPIIYGKDITNEMSDL